MSKDFAVVRYGLDVYSRPVYMTAYMRDWFENYCAELGFTPLIAQGAYMTMVPGGGAAASSGAHDKGKCLDLRTTDRTDAEVDVMVRTARLNGAGAYRRDMTAQHGGMTPHMHLTLGSDAPGSPMAELLWASYVAGGDGLGAGPGRPAGAPDYEFRPDPLVLVPPEVDMTPAQAAQLDGLTKAVASLADMVEALAEGNEAIKKRITKAKREVLAAVEEQL